MTGQTRVEEALGKFEAAMHLFEGAVVQVRQQSENNVNVESEAAALRDDRSRMAAELDRTKAQMSEMSVNNAEAEKRIADAMSAISSVLGHD